MSLIARQAMDSSPGHTIRAKFKNLAAHYINWS